MKLFLISLFFSLMMFITHPLSANGQVHIETGYRYDRIDELNEILDTIDPTFFLSIEQQFKDLQSYVLGARGWWQIPCTSFLIQGGGHFNWILDGNYNNEYIERAQNHGHSWDVTGALGYLFKPTDWFSCSPLIGFSYDIHHLRMFNSSTSVPIQIANVAEGAHWSSSWYGPWAGVNFFFNTSSCLPLTFEAGYEFHYGWSRTSWHQAVNNPTALMFSYTTYLNNLSGQVLHIESHYYFFNQWIAGIKLQYSLWENKHGARSHIPPPSETGLTPTQFQRTTFLSWRSFAATFNLGCCF